MIPTEAPPVGDARPRPVPAGPPVGVEHLDVTWVASALGLPEHVLTGVTATRIGSDRGHLGSSYRLDLGYASRPAYAPRSVVVKLPALNEESRSTAGRGRLYEREYRFFTQLAPDTAARAPHCYAAGYDEGTDTFALVLEDVSSTVEVDQLTGCPVQLAALTLAELARLHAGWWSSPTLYELPWLTTFTHADRVANLSRLLQQGWPLLCDTVGDRLGPEARRLGEAVLDYLPRGLAALEDDPQTLLHGDPRLDNLLFDAGEQRAPIVLLDWQNVSRGAPAFDVAYFLAQSLTAADLRAHGSDLVAGYHADLVGHGVTDFPVEALNASLRHALPVSFAVAASVAVLGDTSDARIAELATGMAERAIAAAEQMGLLSELQLA